MCLVYSRFLVNLWFLGPLILLSNWFSVVFVVLNPFDLSNHSLRLSCGVPPLRSHTKHRDPPPPPPWPGPPSAGPRLGRGGGCRRRGSRAGCLPGGAKLPGDEGTDGICVLGRSFRRFAWSYGKKGSTQRFSLRSFEKDSSRIWNLGVLIPSLVYMNRKVWGENKCFTAVNVASKECSGVQTLYEWIHCTLVDKQYVLDNSQTSQRLQKMTHPLLTKVFWPNRHQ